MDDDICIGIMVVDDQLEVTARQPGAEDRFRLFLANSKGLQALAQFVCALRRPVRIAVAGTAAVSVALALATVPESEIFVVSSVVADKSLDLARYAERAI